MPVSDAALHDRHMVFTALAVCGGALLAHSVAPVWFVGAAGIALIGVAARRPYALMVGLAVVSSVLAARSWGGLEAQPPQSCTRVGLSC